MSGNSNSSLRHFNIKRYTKKEIQGDLIDKDFERVGEVVEKQDLWSKSSRRVFIAKIWIPRLIVYNMVCLAFSVLFFCYSIYHYTVSPTPLYLFEKMDGLTICSNSVEIDQNGKVSRNLDQNQRNMCNLLNNFNK